MVPAREKGVGVGGGMQRAESGKLRRRCACKLRSLRQAVTLVPRPVLLYIGRNACQLSCT